MQPRRIAATVALVLALPGLSACGSSDDGGSKGSTTASGKCTGNRGTIGFTNIGPESDDPVLAALTRVTKLVAKQNCFDTVVLDNNYDGPKAIQNAQVLVNRRVKYAIQFQGFENVNKVISAKYNAARIPVVTYDIPGPGMYFLGAPNKRVGEQAGRAAGEEAKRRWDCKADLVLLIGDKSVGSVSDDRIGGFRSGIQAVCPELGSKVSEVDNAGARTAVAASRDALTAKPGAKRIVVGGVNDDVVTNALTAADQLGRGKEIFGWGTDGSLVTRPGVDKRLLGSVAFFIESYPQYAFQRVIAPLVAGKQVPVGDSPASPDAILVESCPITTAQGQALPSIDKRVAALAKAPAGTTMAKLFCPKKAS